MPLRTHGPRAYALIDLVTDANFLRLTELCRRPNLFSCLARTYTETWHSMFLAWLLDPKGSHGLVGYPFALLCRCAGQSPYGATAVGWSRLAALANADTVEVSPNERDPREHAFGDSTRADILLRNIALDGQDLDAPRHLVVIEQKVRAPVSETQLDGYRHNVTSGSSAIFHGILVAPRYRLEERLAYLQGPAGWTGIDYQMLHDGLLAPCLGHPSLPQRTKFLLSEYVENLRTMKGESMSVISEEERELAKQIWGKHKEALRLLARALEDVPETQSVTNTVLADEDDGGSPTLSITVNGQPIMGDTVPEFLEDYLTKLDQLGVLAAAEKKGLIPYRTSDKRYFIARTPAHPGGNEFVRKVAVNGWYVEANRNLEQALKRCREFAMKADCAIG